MARRYVIGILLLIFLAVSFLSACSRQQAAQPDTLEAFTAQLDALLPDLLRRYHAPGAAVALVQDGRVAWAQGYGLADETTRAPMTTATMFQVASLSKSVTAWGVMRLVEEGRIDLDAPVGRYLKSWTLPPSKYDPNGVTVRRLLSHTAGIAAWDYAGAPIEATSPTPAELLSAEPVRLVRQAGERELYTNGGYTLLELLVEDVTGESFAAYMQREILNPLGMHDSTFRWDPALRATLATGYQVSGRPTEHRSYPAAAGGLYATVGDMATWLAAGMSGPRGEPVGRGVLQPQTVALMYAPVLATPGGGNGLGYVSETLPNGARMVLHSGDILGWRGQYTALPDLGAGIVVLTNSNAAGRYVVADATCRWIAWAAGVTPRACQTYQVVYVVIPVIAGIGGLIVLASVWRLAAQIRSGRRTLVWPPKTDDQRRSIVFSLIALAGWWLLVEPRIGLLLPPTFMWITLAFTLWCLASAVKGLTRREGAVATLPKPNEQQPRRHQDAKSL